MRIFLLFMLAGLLLSGKLLAQDGGQYKDALGVRIGIYPGVSYKHFFSNVTAFELLAQAKHKGVIGTLLYQAHWQAFGSERLRWILGFGGHVGSFGAGELEDPDGEPYEKDVITLGVDAILGVEYFFEDAPLTFGLDLKPFADLVNPGPDFFDAALTIRYAFP